MIIKKEFYNIKCDCCGQVLDEEEYWDEIEGVESMLDTCGWKAMENGRHYCHDCWEWDDDDNIQCKDGRKYDEDCQEIMTHRMSYMEVGEWMTLTQFRTEIARSEALFHTMIGSPYKAALYDDIQESWRWFDELLAMRRGTPEYACFSTFLSHGIFRRFGDDTYDRLYRK